MARTGRPIAILALLVLVALSEVRPALASQARAVKDGWLVLKVHSEMVDEDLLSGSDIDVDVKDGVVTLRGTVARGGPCSRAGSRSKERWCEVGGRPTHDRGPAGRRRR
jgi:hypothetical protein